jgi:acetoin utilization protein AcuB
MKIRDIMRSEDLVTISPVEPIGLAAQLMLWAGVRHLPVVRNNDVVGILSERDIFRRNGEVGQHAAAQEPVEKAMRAPVITIGPDETVLAAATLMVSRKVGSLPVVAAQGLLGIVTTTDVLRNDLEEARARVEATAPTVRTVMKRATAVGPDTLLFDAAALMGRRCIRHLPVVDTEGKVVGIVSDRDVRAALGDPRRLLQDVDNRAHAGYVRVRDVMAKVVVTLGQDAPLATAIERLAEQGIGALPIVDQGQRLVGILSYLDVIEALRQPGSSGARRNAPL